MLGTLSRSCHLALPDRSPALMLFCLLAPSPLVMPGGQGWAPPHLSSSLQLRSYLPYTSPTHSLAQGWVGAGVCPSRYLSDPILLPWTLVFGAPWDNEDSAPHCPHSVALSPFPSPLPQPIPELLL